ncbi:unnamed protein product [Rhodiola kirilowii]
MAGRWMDEAAVDGRTKTTTMAGWHNDGVMERRQQRWQDGATTVGGGQRI